MADDRRDAPSVPVDVFLSEQEIAAIIGWQRAQGLESFDTAIRHLLRLGLLTEIGRIYQEDAYPYN